MDESVENTNQSLAGSSVTNLRIYEFLRDNRVGVLATVSDDNTPHAAVIYYSIDESFVISFVTKVGTQKNSNLENDSRVMFISFDEKTQTTAQVTGRVEKIADSAKTEEIHGAMLDAVMQTTDNGEEIPVDKLDAGDYVAYTLKPNLIRMAVFIRPENDDGDVFETIEFNT